MSARILKNSALYDDLSNEANNIFSLEDVLRKEKGAWLAHWLAGAVILAFLLYLYLIEDSLVGKLGLYLLCIPVLLNAAISIPVLKGRTLPWIRYAFAFIEITTLTLYNSLDTYFHSPLAPVSTAALLLYPATLILTAIWFDRMLIIAATIYTVICMNALYVIAYPHFDQNIAAQIVSSGITGQIYRTGFILLCGALLLAFPQTLIRILNRQKLLHERNTEHFSQAHHDTLTGLANRRLFMKYLHKITPLARRHNYQFALLYIDLDGFKAVNDSLGHDAGDHLLCEIALRISTIARDSDLVARFGGDEFAVIAQRVEGRQGAEIIASRIIEAIRMPVQIGEKQASVSASIGIAVFPEHGEAIEQLIQLADAALYKVKNSGKNSFSFAS